MICISRQRKKDTRSRSGGWLFQILEVLLSKGRRMQMRLEGFKLSLVTIAAESVPPTSSGK